MLERLKKMFSWWPIFGELPTKELDVPYKSAPDWTPQYERLPDDQRIDIGPKAWKLEE